MTKKRKMQRATEFIKRALVIKIMVITTMHTKWMPTLP